jgi:hypothetical protein
MAGFEYRPYQSREWTGSLADIIAARGRVPAEAALRVGQIQADATRQNGQIAGGAVQQLGQIAGQAVQQIGDARKTATIQGLIKSTPKVDLGDGVLGYDLPAISEAIVAKGGDPSQLMSHLAPLNQSLQQLHAGRVATVQRGAQGLLAAGGDPMLAGDFFDLLEHNKVATPEQLRDFRSFATTPEKVMQLATKFAGPQKVENAAPGSMARNPYTGQLIEGSQVPEKTPPPGQGDYTINGQRFNAKGEKIGDVQPSQAVPPTKSLQMKSVLVDGKPTEASYNPTDGSWQVGGQAIEASRVRPIPPASITIHNQNAQASNIPTWATDDSRPTGPEANKPDPNIRMTPNGLYQAAQNYIANGQFPPTGLGTNPIAIAQREAITSKVGAIAAASGMDVPSLRAFFKSNAASLGQQQKMYDSVQGFMATADKNATLLEASLKKLPDLGVPIFNKPFRTFEKDVAGDPNLSQFSTYLKSVQNEYARIISQPNLAGQLTDSARHEAEVLIDPKSTVPQIVASIQALKNEGTNRLVSVGEQIQRIQSRMTTAPAAPAAGGGPAIGTVRTYNGETRRWTGTEWVKQ